MFKNTASKFTLLELLIVIAIITVLISLLVPTLKNAKENASKIQCLGNQKVIGQGIIMYAMDYNNFIVSVSNNNDDKLFSMLSPYIGNNKNNYGCANKVVQCPSSNNYVGYGGNYKHVLSFGEVDIWRKANLLKRPSHKCSVMDMYDDSNRDYYQFARCSTCYPVDNYINYPHLQGGNLLFFDAHGEWLKAFDISSNNEDVMGHY
jgi:competence protein ComGC